MDKHWARAAKPAIVAATLTLVPLAGMSAAHADTAVTCKPSNLNTCVVTIPLTSDMNEELSSTMPDNNPWFLNEADGNSVHAPYSLIDPGWDGSDANTSGHVWDAQLTTGDNEPAGGTAVLTFRHVKSISKPTPTRYKFSHLSAPARAKRGATVTIAAAVTPKPAKGHLLLQRESGRKWIRAKTLAYDSRHKKWVTHLTLTGRAHTTTTYRLEATAAKGLKAAHSHTFRITTK
jgi:hypothetical protein